MEIITEDERRAVEAWLHLLDNPGPRAEQESKITTSEASSFEVNLLDPRRLILAIGTVTSPRARRATSSEHAQQFSKRDSRERRWRSW
jgi:hypothetical protein